MALNFPRPDQSPYVDPDSGLKYIYNATIGAWESAIQPPAIVTYDCQPPDIIIDGFLWFNNCDLTLYIYRNGDWIPVVDGEYGPVFIGINPPSNPSNGDLWWDPVSGVLFVWYVEAATLDPSAQWMPCFNGSGGSLGDTGGAYVGPFAPSSPAEGQLWLNTNNNILYVYTEADGWIANQSELNGVIQINGNFPIQVTDDNPIYPVINIADSTIVNKGAVRLATNQEASLGNSNEVAVTPASLKFALTDITSNGILPVATETQKGIIEIATADEVLAGTDNDKAVTPAGLQSALPQLGVTNPPGTIIAFAGQNAPGGYLVCDGSQYDISLYPELFDAIFVTYGGNGIDKFNVPDLRGEFIRGWNGLKSSGDTNRVFGSWQADGIGPHKHSVVTTNTQGGDPNVNYGTGQRTPPIETIETDVAIGGTTETRPRNVAMLYCIKT